MIDSLLARFGLIREDRLIDACMDLRNDLPRQGEVGYVSDRRWKFFMQKARGGA